MKLRLWDKGASADQNILAFTIGDDPTIDLHIAPWDIIASCAHARMLCKQGFISFKEQNDLLSELSTLYDKTQRGTFHIPYELEDCHTAIETYLVEALGDTGKKIHTGRSRNDQVLVAVRLYLRSAILEHAQQLAHLAETILQKAKDFYCEPFPGYTHMQPAMPTTVGIWLHSYAEYALSLLQDGFSVYRLINHNPLGVASGFGVPIDLDREYTSNLLGFSSPQRNSIFVQSTRGREELKYLAWLSDISTLMEKIGSDLCLFFTQEFGFVSLPESFTTGSSIMPQKKNPDVVELLRARASQTRAARIELEGTVSKLPSHYHRDYQYTKAPLIRAKKNVSECLEISKLVLEQLTVQKENIRNAMTPELYATYDVYQQVQNGTSFREAYMNTAQKLHSQTLHTHPLQIDTERVIGVAWEEFEIAQKELAKWQLEYGELMGVQVRICEGVFLCEGL